MCGVRLLGNISSYVLTISCGSHEPQRAWGSVENLEIGWYLLINVLPFESDYLPLFSLSYI